MDEPLLARDIKGRRMLDLFLASMLESGRAVMLISHDLGVIAEFVDKVVVMYAGRVVETGSYSELSQLPAGRLQALIDAGASSPVIA